MPSQPLVAGLLLAGAIGANGWFLRGGFGVSRDRAGRYRRWLKRAPLAMLVPTLIALLMLGRIDALWMVPAEFASVRTMLPDIAAEQVIFGSVAGAIGGLIVVAVRAWRGHRPRGAMARFIPDTVRERRWGAGVALGTGVVEEPFYRLLLPLLTALTVGSALAGFAVSSLLFAVGHRYQGTLRMLASGAFGTVLAAFYVLSGQLWLVVLLHVLVNIGPMVVWPAISSSAASRSGRSR